MATAGTKNEKQLALDFKVESDKSYKFRMLKVRNGNTIIQKEDIILDDITSSKRKLRYNTDSISPFLDDQLKDGKEEAPSSAPIVFTKGSLTVAGFDEPLVRYLMAHGSNVSRKKQLDARNKDYLFELIDYAAIAQAAVASTEEILDAKLLVREKFVSDIKSLEYFMASRFGVYNEEIGEFKTQVYQKAEALPSAFLNDLNNKVHKFKYEIKDAIAKGILKVSNSGEVKWNTGAIVGVFSPDAKTGDITDTIAAWSVSGVSGVKEFKEILEQQVTSKN